MPRRGRPEAEITQKNRITPHLGAPDLIPVSTNLTTAQGFFCLPSFIRGPWTPVLCPSGSSRDPGGDPRVRVAFRRRACAFVGVGCPRRERGSGDAIPPVCSKASLENTAPLLQEMRLSGKVLPVTAVKLKKKKKRSGFHGELQRFGVLKKQKQLLGCRNGSKLRASALQIIALKKSRDHCLSWRYPKPQRGSFVGRCP